jgi:hypothetical protein
MKFRPSIGVGLFAVVVVVGLIRFSRQADTVPEGVPTLDVAGEQSVRVPEPEFTGDVRSSHEPVAADVESAVTGDAVAVDSDGLRLLQSKTLQLTIESTLMGQVDPGAFLDTALALSKLEISKSPIPEPSVSGAIRYPLLGVPEGVTAELWVARATTERFTSPLLTYHLSVNTSTDYVFEGAARNGLVAKISLWTDRQGNVSNYGVLTESMVSGRSRKVGLDWMGRTVPIGVLFSYDPSHPYEWSATTSVLKDGMSEDLPDPAIVHGQWPRLDDLEALKSGLLKQYGAL